MYSVYVDLRDCWFSDLYYWNKGRLGSPKNMGNDDDIWNVRRKDGGHVLEFVNRNDLKDCVAFLTRQNCSWAHQLYEELVS